MCGRGGRCLGGRARNEILDCGFYRGGYVVGIGYPEEACGVGGREDALRGAVARMVWFLELKLMIGEGLVRLLVKVYQTNSVRI